MGWLAGRLAGWFRLKEAVRLTGCQVLTMRMDGPGWRGREGKSGQGNRRRRRASGKLSIGDGSTLMRATISLPLSFFVGGGGQAGGGSLTTKEGRVVARVWVAGTRYLGTSVSAHDIDIQGAGEQVLTSSLWYTGTYRPD